MTKVLLAFDFHACTLPEYWKDGSVVIFMSISKTGEWSDWRAWG